MLNSSECPADRRAVLVPVGAYDRRAVTAARFAATVPARGCRAVHVAVHAEEAVRLGMAWMRSAPLGLRLEISDDRGGVAETVSSLARRELVDGIDEVLVVGGELSMRGPCRRLLHDRTAASIADALAGVPGVRWVSLAVPL